MKKLFILTLFIGLLSSCDNTPIEVKNPEKETTLEIQQLAKADSICYKVVELRNHVYILKDDKVIKKVDNDSGALNTVILGLLLLFLFFIIIGIILD